MSIDTPNSHRAVSKVTQDDLGTALCADRPIGAPESLRTCGAPRSVGSHLLRSAPYLRPRWVPPRSVGNRPIPVWPLPAPRWSLHAVRVVGFPTRPGMRLPGERPPPHLWPKAKAQCSGPTNDVQKRRSHRRRRRETGLHPGHQRPGQNKQDTCQPKEGHQKAHQPNPLQPGSGGRDQLG